MSDTTSDRHIDSALNNISKMSEYIKTGRQEVLEVGMDLIENKIEDPGIDSLQDCIVELVKAEHRVKAFTQSVNSIKTRWQNGDLDDDEDVVEMLENDLKAEEERSMDEKYVWDHEFMTAFIDQMKTADPDVQLKTGSNTSASCSSNGVSGEMEIIQAEVALKCPITQCEMTDPVMDPTCSHTFEKDAIHAHIKQNLKRKRQPKCPYPGCKNILVLARLESNAAVKRMIERKKRGHGETSS
uniref:E3 SUMO-protein ligase NSE2 n=1 Tax=Phallusia mammillata TaxID=59560 RepID=A0A6F9DN37_9ASCI|nr:E3 SUMO-protein ligase NSE2 [Phallusia mammillata]